MFVWYTNETGVPHVAQPSRVERVARTKRARPVADGSSSPDGAASTDTPPRKRNPYEEPGVVPPRREPAVLAGQIASSPVVTLPLDTSLGDAWRLVQERRFRHVPIVSAEGRLVGILSDRDLLREAATLTTRSEAVGEETVGGETGGGESATARTVGDLMKRTVLTATPETEIRAVAGTMLEERLGAMPIVDGNGHLVGILTRSDILRALMRHAPLDLWT